MSGWRMLLYKEVLRFWKVSFQTIAAPVLTSVLYMLIFGHVLEDHVKVYDNVPYTAFLLPGLIMMSVLQNAFANSSSSLVQSKIMGNVVFLLLTPLSHWHWFVAYVGSSMLRGLALSGVFYSIHSLPPFWQGLSHLNPFFYMIDGFRYGFFGQSDVSPWTSLAVVSVAMLAVSALAIHWLKSGYKIRG
ncbi:MAG: ABC transporter permease [Comamonadaceae bacterium]|nr:ABC transporter permease [Comamonadaceae bacterium]